MVYSSYSVIKKGTMLIAEEPEIIAHQIQTASFNSVARVAHDTISLLASLFIRPPSLQYRPVVHCVPASGGGNVIVYVATPASGYTHDCMTLCYTQPQLQQPAPRCLQFYESQPAKERIGLTRPHHMTSLRLSIA